MPTLQACSDNFRWNEREESTRVASRRVYELYLDKLRELEMKPISFIGHGIGLHLHEDPYLGPTPDQPLEAGMVLGVEPLVMDTGYGLRYAELRTWWPSPRQDASCFLITPTSTL